MGIKSSSQRRVTASSAISSGYAISANPAGGVILTGQNLTANTVVNQQTVTPGQTNSASTAAVGGGSTTTAPTYATLPAITGTKTNGQTLSLTNPWVGATPITFTYQWNRSGSAMSGATASTYTLVTVDVGSTITCTIIATNSVGSMITTTSATSSIAAIAPISAPTISSFTDNDYSNVSVNLTTADTGGSTITSYTVTRSPGNVTVTGTSPVTFTGLTATTQYSFTAVATNAIGTGPSSSSVNHTTISQYGSQSYTTPGTYSWVAPAGVTAVSVVAVGGGSSASSYFGIGGAGGGLGYKNNYSVTPGNSYTVVVGSGGYGGTSTAFTGIAGGASSFAGTLYAYGGLAPTAGSAATGTSTGGSYSGGCGGGMGGGSPGPYSNGTTAGTSSYYMGSGGGGAGGYSGYGGNGAGASGGAAFGSYQGASAGSGGGGGGGGGNAINNSTSDYDDNGGGGVGLFGQGSNGAAGITQTAPYTTGYAGGGGSGGSAGTAPANNSTPGNGGAYGGGGGSSHGNYSFTPSGSGAGGAVRIVWPGNLRTFPSTCVASP